MQPAEPSAIKRAVSIVGNQSILAGLVDRTPQAVQKWCESGRVPAEHVIKIEEATGGKITRHELRPDLYPEKTAA